MYLQDAIQDKTRVAVDPADHTPTPLIWESFLSMYTGMISELETLSFLACPAVASILLLIAWFGTSSDGPKMTQVGVQTPEMSYFDA